MTQNCPVAGSCSAVDRSIVISAKTTLTWNSCCSPWYTGWMLGECGQMSSKTTLTLKLGILSEDMWRLISTLLHPILESHLSSKACECDLRRLQKRRVGKTLRGARECFWHVCPPRVSVADWASACLSRGGRCCGGTDGRSPKGNNGGFVWYGLLWHNTFQWLK